MGKSDKSDKAQERASKSAVQEEFRSIPATDEHHALLRQYSPAQTETETYVRAGVGVAHAIGSQVLSAFGLGGLSAPIGALENVALDAGFKK